VEFLSQEVIHPWIVLPEAVEQVPGMSDAGMQKLLGEVAEQKQELQQLREQLRSISHDQDSAARALSTYTEQASGSEEVGMQAKLIAERQEQIQQLLAGIDGKVGRLAASQERLEAELVGGDGDGVRAAQCVSMPPKGKTPIAGAVARAAEERRLAEQKAAADRLREEQEREEDQRCRIYHCVAFHQERQRYLCEDEEEDVKDMAARMENIAKQREFMLNSAGLTHLRKDIAEPVALNTVKTQRKKTWSETAFSLEDVIVRCEETCH